MASPSSSEKQHAPRKSTDTFSEDRTATATPDFKTLKEEKQINNDDPSEYPERSSRDGSTDDNGNELAPQESNASSIWVAETMSFPREVLFIIICCMAQFCTRELDPPAHVYTIHTPDPDETDKTLQRPRTWKPSSSST